MQQDCKLRHILLRCNTCKYMYKRNSTWLGLIPSYSHRLYPIIQHPSSKNTSAQKQPSTFTPPRTSLSPSPFSLSALSESEWSPVNFAARLQLQALTSQWHHSCPLKSVKHPGLEFLPPSPQHPPGSDAEIEKHNVGWADREGGEKGAGAEGGGLGVGGNGGVVFLALVTQLERRSTNKRILCPKWLPCKLLSTLIYFAYVSVFVSNDRRRDYRENKDEWGLTCVWSNHSMSLSSYLTKPVKRL